jgi:hypothetical protein
MPNLPYVVEPMRRLPLLSLLATLKAIATG